MVRVLKVRLGGTSHQSTLAELGRLGASAHALREPRRENGEARLPRRNSRPNHGRTNSFPFACAASSSEFQEPIYRVGVLYKSHFNRPSVNCCNLCSANGAVSLLRFPIPIQDNFPRRQSRTTCGTSYGFGPHLAATWVPRQPMISEGQRRSTPTI